MDEFVSMKKFIKLAAVAGMHISVAAFGQSESQDVSLNEVRKLTDQTLLAKIAVENKSALTRSTAAEKLTNQVLLEKIAVEDKEIGRASCRERV